jgi:hypothetical protein
VTARLPNGRDGERANARTAAARCEAATATTVRTAGGGQGGHTGRTRASNPRVTDETRNGGVEGNRGKQSAATLLIGLTRQPIRVRHGGNGSIVEHRAAEARVEPSGVGSDGSRSHTGMRSRCDECVESGHHRNASTGSSVDTKRRGRSRKKLTAGIVNRAMQEEMRVIFPRHRIATRQAGEPTKVGRTEVLLPRLIECSERQIGNAHPQLQAGAEPLGATIALAK